MVRSVPGNVEHFGERPSRDDEVADTIRDLVGAFGVRRVVEAVNELAKTSAAAPEGNAAALRLVQVMLREIAYSKTPQLTAEIMALGAGLLLENRQAITTIATKHGLSRQAVSKRAVRFCDENGLPPSVFMRSKENRAVYKMTNRPKNP